MFPKKKSIIAQKITQNKTQITEYRKNFLKETLNLKMKRVLKKESPIRFSFH